MRADLPPGFIVAQACHATRAFGLEHPEAEVGENLVVLAVYSLEHLERYGRDAQKLGPASFFHEPDLAGEMTAFATTRAARRLLSSLPLAFKSCERYGTGCHFGD